ncbi:hypothetical protein MishRS11D_17640 [Methylomagnum ishizawai]|nr:hypothetical protein MishRS11D_17640 [Methylomagnum ishizawai]
MRGQRRARKLRKGLRDRVSAASVSIGMGWGVPGPAMMRRRAMRHTRLGTGRFGIHADKGHPCGFVSRLHANRWPVPRPKIPAYLRGKLGHGDDPIG